MKNLVFIALMLPVALLAQVKDDRAWITNPGRIALNYTFTPADEDVLKKTFGKDKETVTLIKANSKPGKWPRSISAVKGFHDNADTIKAYVTYFVCNLGGNKTLLKVPANENEEHGVNLRPATDIYFIINYDAVVYEEPEKTPAAK